jgi:hypothetical protein
LSDQRWEAAQLYDGNFVLGWDMSAMIHYTMERVLTIDSEVAECGTGSALNLEVTVLQQEQDWLQGISINLAYI